MRPDIRLIAVDLDGTLLNDRKEIPADFIPMVEALYPRGVRFVIDDRRDRRDRNMDCRGDHLSFYPFIVPSLFIQTVSRYRETALLLSI